jgi:hypothetical protein
MAAVKIWGEYQGSAEVIDEASSWKEARRLAGEYRLAYGAGWLIWCGRKKDRPT